jgi:PAS domain S-box-containing protein
MLECSDNSPTPRPTVRLVSHAVVRPTLLVIAEGDDVRSALAHTVRLYGVRQVQTAADAQAAATASRIIPDVIVISAGQHPDKQAATIRDLRSNLITRHTPIVARVVEPSQSLTESLRSAGADRVVVATSENSTLINTIIRLSDVPAPCRALRELRRSLTAIRQRTADQRTDAAAVRVRTAQLASALQQFKVCMLALESSGRCVAANQMTTALTGLSREEIVGKCLWDIVLTGAGRDLRTNWSTVVGALNGPCALRRRDGGSVAAEMYVAAAILPELHVAAIQTAS